MKIASSSASFERRLRAGELTQLEWLDLCAQEFALDGVVFDLRHFPRTDDEYLAQLKKLCTDLGLTVAAVTGGDLLEAEAAIPVAVRLGAPLVLSRAPRASDETSAWNRLAGAARSVAASGKAANVTIAVRNVPETLCAGAADLKRLAKDTDSAWLRYALDVANLPANEAPESLVARSVIACHDLTSLRSEPERDEVTRLAATLRDLRGFLVVDCTGEDAAPADLEAAVRTLRACLAQAALAACTW